jgi:DNA-directed RNA polymerase subunit A'
METSKRKPEIVGENTIIIMAEGADPLSLQRMKTKILNSRLKGIPGITEASVVHEGDEWDIQTKGSNLAKVMKIDGVDPARTTTNDIYEIWSTLGIEAARSALVREVRNTMEEQGLEVDIRHIYLVADLMTVTGSLKQVGRHGVVGGKASVLARAAFEITVPTLAEASVKGETEQLRGVTESVIVGIPIPVGTGIVDLFMTQGGNSDGKENA